MSPYRHALMPMTNFGIAKNTKTKYVEKAKICCNETQHEKPNGMIYNNKASRFMYSFMLHYCQK